MNDPLQLAIQTIRARGLTLVPDRPVETASGVMPSTPVVLIDLVTAEGIIGRSYVRCYTPLALQPLAQLSTNLEGLLTGAGAVPLTVERTLQQHFCFLGLQGLTVIALAGIDVALWDARAKACGVPLVTLLGGAPGRFPPMPACGQ